MTDIIVQETEHSFSLPNPSLVSCFPIRAKKKKKIHHLLRFQYVLLHFRVLLSKVRDAPQNFIPSPSQTSAYIPLIK